MTTIAVTGHMDLTDASVPLVRGELDRLLAVYDAADLVGVSCIAKGSDSVSAEAVLAVGGRLIVVIPSRDYRQVKVKPDHAATFDRLVGAADEVLVMPHDAVFSTEAWEKSRESEADLDVAVLTDPHAGFAAGLRLADVAHWPQDGGHWWCSRDSWAYAADGAVHQWGPRDLADETAEALAWWEGAGRPELFDFGLTVTADATGCGLAIPRGRGPCPPRSRSAVLSAWGRPARPTGRLRRGCRIGRARRMGRVRRRFARFARLSSGAGGRGRRADSRPPGRWERPPVAASVCRGWGPPPDRRTPRPLRRWTTHQLCLDGAPSHSTPQGVPPPKTFDKVVASDQAFSEGVPGGAAPPGRAPDRHGPRARWPSRHGPPPARRSATRLALRPRPPLLNRAKRARRYPRLTSGLRSEGAIEAASLYGAYERATYGWPPPSSTTASG